MGTVWYTLSSSTLSPPTSKVHSAECGSQNSLLKSRLSPSEIWQLFSALICISPLVISLEQKAELSRWSMSWISPSLLLYHNPAVSSVCDNSTVTPCPAEISWTPHGAVQRVLLPASDWQLGWAHSLLSQLGSGFSVLADELTHWETRLISSFRQGLWLDFTSRKSLPYID